MAADIDGYRQGIGTRLSESSPAIEFIATFMRFEFALKHGGFLKGERGHRAEPGWDDLAGKLGTGFFADMQAAPQAHIFFSAPPKRLVVAEDRTPKVEPGPVDPPKNAQDLLKAVRQVRNNLFHGAKPDLGTRDMELIEASLFVLDCTMAACETTSECEQVPVKFEHAPVNGA